MKPTKPERFTTQLFIARICEETGCSHKEAADIYDIFMGILEDEVLRGNRVMLYRFGTFMLKPHKGHPPNFRREERLDDYLNLKFVPAPTIKKKLKELDSTILDKVNQLAQENDT